MNKKYKVLAFDLDGTLTQHRTPLEKENRQVLERLSKEYKLIMVGAGACGRIFEQMEHFPIDIIGNYGMERAVYNYQTKGIDIVEKVTLTPDKEKVTAICDKFRAEYGYTDYSGESVEFHQSGMITFALLGTKAKIEDKLAFDPTREKRRKFFDKVIEAFSDYTVFIGGSSSFDMAPKPYNKRYALEKYCKDNGIDTSEVLYFGDDYGVGGGDEHVYRSEFDFAKVDKYTDFSLVVKEWLE